MSFTRILQADLNARGATTLPNQPTISATALKTEFDAPAKEVVAPAVNRLIDELEDTAAAASIGAVAPVGRTVASPTVQTVIEKVSTDLGTLETAAQPAILNEHTHANKALLDDYTHTDAEITTLVSESHVHGNKPVLDDLSDVGGSLEYKGNPIDGTVKAAFKTVSASGVNIVASGEDKVTFKAGANVTLAANATTKEITISSSGGGGGGGGDMYEADYDNAGTVKAAGGIDAYVTTEIAGKADISSLASVATSGDYTDLSNTPTIPADLDDLSDVTITTPSPNDVLKYNGSGWVNGTAPASGHTMLPTPSAGVTESDVVTAIRTGVTEGGTNDDVASLYSIGTWSNSYTKTLLIQASQSHPISTTGIGTWQDTLNSPTKADEQGWGWIEWSELHGIGSANVDVRLTFDPTTSSVPITLGGYIIDDSTDMMCIKFGNEIGSGDVETALIGVEIIVSRTVPTTIAP